MMRNWCLAVFFSMLMCLGVFAQDATDSVNSDVTLTEAQALEGDLSELMGAEMEASLESLPAGAKVGIITVLLTVFLLPTIISLIIQVIMLVALWRILTKAGIPGWSILIPIYGAIMVLKACGKPWWWLLILSIPFVGWFILPVIPCIGLANKFGKSTGFGILVWLVPIVGLSILGFGKATHEDGPAAEQDEDASSGSPSIRTSSKSSAANLVPAKGLGIWATLSIISALCFGAVIILQALENTYYEQGPEKRSVWPAEGSP